MKTCEHHLLSNTVVLGIALTGLVMMRVFGQQRPGLDALRRLSRLVRRGA
jgi:hypothetical protein